jgi:hypothetical protein
VYRPSLALQDHPVDGGELAEQRQTDVTDLGAERLQSAGNVFQRGPDLSIGWHVFLVEVPDGADDVSVGFRSVARCRRRSASSTPVRCDRPSHRRMAPAHSGRLNEEELADWRAGARPRIGSLR